MNTSLGPQFCRLFHWNHLSWLVQLKACIFPLLKSKKQRISCTLLNEIKLQASRSKQRSGMAKWYASLQRKSSVFLIPYNTCALYLFHRFSVKNELFNMSIWKNIWLFTASYASNIVIQSCAGAADFKNLNFIF